MSRRTFDGESGFRFVALCHGDVTLSNRCIAIQLSCCKLGLESFQFARICLPDGFQAQISHNFVDFLVKVISLH